MKQYFIKIFPKKQQMLGMDRTTLTRGLERLEKEKHYEYISRHSGRTLFTFSNVDYESPVEDRRFNKESLRKGL